MTIINTNEVLINIFYSIKLFSWPTLINTSLCSGLASYDMILYNFLYYQDHRRTKKGSMKFILHVYYMCINKKITSGSTL